MNPVCLLLGHHRSRSRAENDPTFGWRSVCERCKAPMVRLGYKNWCLESKAPLRASAGHSRLDDRGALDGDRPRQA